MAKVGGWSANEYSRTFLSGDENRQLNEFCNAHKAVYIFGAGKIGTGFSRYLRQCDVPLKGFVTSDTFYEFKKLYRQGETGLVVGVSDKNLAEIMPLVKPIVAEQDIFIANSSYREKIRWNFVEFEKKIGLCVYLVSHCNLGCKGCAVFAPVARPDVYEYEELKRDFTQVRKMGLQVETVNFSGGEPLLHPDLFRVFRFTRELLPDVQIKCCTNGILLRQFSDEQLEELCGLNVITQITVYPPCRNDVDAFCKKADELGLKYTLGDYEESRLFTFIMLDESESAPKYDFYNCPKFTDTRTIMFIYKGKIFKCKRPASIHILNEHFNTAFNVREGDFVDLYNTTPEKIFELKSKRTPFCGYCNSVNRSLFEWGLSERKIDEWVHIDNDKQGEMLCPK